MLSDPRSAELILMRADADFRRAERALNRAQTLARQADFFSKQASIAAQAAERISKMHKLKLKGVPHALVVEGGGDEELGPVSQTVKGPGLVAVR